MQCLRSAIALAGLLCTLQAESQRRTQEPECCPQPPFECCAGLSGSPECCPRERAFENRGPSSQAPENTLQEAVLFEEVGQGVCYESTTVTTTMHLRVANAILCRRDCGRRAECTAASFWLKLNICIHYGPGECPSPLNTLEDEVDETGGYITYVRVSDATRAPIATTTVSTRTMEPGAKVVQAKQLSARHENGTDDSTDTSGATTLMVALWSALTAAVGLQL